MNTPSPQRHARLLSEARAMRPSGQALFRAALSATIAQTAQSGRQEHELRQRYGDDPAAALVLRAATTPASLQDDEWAAIAASTAVADFIANLAPTSAAAALIASSLRVDLGRNASVLVPTMIPTASAAGFVGEGEPIGVVAAAVSGPTITPRKIGVMTAMTRETLRSSAAAPVFRALLTESASLALDAALFSAAAAVAGVRPAGLLHGVTALTATAGGGDEAMVGDLEALTAAVAPVAGDNIVLIGSPGLQMKLAARRVSLPVPVLTTGALAAGTLVAIAPAALITVLDPVPSIDSSRDAVVHMDDDPLHIGTTSDTGAVIAAPTRSAYQTDTVVTRLILQASWALRAPGAIAHLTGAAW